MAASNEHLSCDVFVTLANLSSIYILLCLPDDVVTSDDEFRRFLQSRDHYWHTYDQLSEALLNAEADLTASLPRHLSESVNNAVPQHHQEVADGFVAAFQCATTTINVQRSAWLDFAVYAGCLSRFLQLFDAEYVSLERPPVTGLCDELTRIVNEFAGSFDSAQMNIAIELLQCQSKWHHYVAIGIQRFNTATDQAQ